MKRYIKASNDTYCVRCIDSRYGDTVYLGKDGTWYNHPYDKYVAKYSKYGAYNKVKQLDANNTDDSLRYDVEKVDTMLYG